MSQQNLHVRERPDVTEHLPSLHAPPAHVTLADRLALRLGLWLLVHSTARVQHRASHTEHALRLHRERSREARELAHQRLVWPSR